MGNRGNLFANIESKFRYADKDEITNIALSSMRELVDALDFLDDRSKLFVMIIGAKLGVTGDGQLNASEKELVDEVFGPVVQESIDYVYDLIRDDIVHSNYETIESLNKAGNTVAMPLLNFILSFAYIDGEIEDEKAEKLESLFGMNLIADHFMSDEEDDSAHTPSTTNLEDEIVAWFQEEDTLYTLDEIQQHFSDRTDSAIQEALDSLVLKDILFGGDTVLGDMYGLV